MFSGSQEMDSGNTEGKSTPAFGERSAASVLFHFAGHRGLGLMAQDRE